jgi:hypothetical protein
MLVIERYSNGEWVGVAKLPPSTSLHRARDEVDYLWETKFGGVVDLRIRFSDRDDAEYEKEARVKSA